MKTHAFETYREKYENVRMKREDGIRGHLRIGGTRLITRALPTLDVLRARTNPIMDG
jgi:hypothetical protein